MAEPRLTTAIARSVRNAGALVSDAAQVDVGHNRLLVTCKRFSWAKALEPVVRVIVEISHDQGRNWDFFCSFEAGANPVDPLMGSGDPSMSVGCEVRDDRLIRVRAEPLRRLDFAVELQTLETAEEKFFKGQQPQSVAFDSVASTDFANVSSTSWTHTNSGTPTGGCVGVSSGIVGTGILTVGTTTWNGAACSSVVTQARALTLTSIRATILSRSSPGSGTVAVAFQEVGNYGGAGSIAVVGGDTTTVTNASNSATAGSGSPSVAVTSAVGDLVMDCVTGNPGPPTETVGAGQTSRWNRANAGSQTRTAASTEPGAASVTMSWTQSGGEWTTVGVNFKAAGNPWYYYANAG